VGTGEKRFDGLAVSRPVEFRTAIRPVDGIVRKLHRYAAVALESLLSRTGGPSP